MNKFEKSINLNGPGVLIERGKIVVSNAKRAQEDKVRFWENKIDELKMKVLTLCDIAPDNTQSLKLTGKVVDSPTQWADELHQTKKEIKLAEIELQIAKDNLAEWFTDEQPAETATQQPQ